jgi:hypothetical protein
VHGVHSELLMMTRWLWKAGVPRAFRSAIIIGQMTRPPVPRVLNLRSFRSLLRGHSDPQEVASAVSIPEVGGHLQDVDYSSDEEEQHRQVVAALLRPREPPTQRTRFVPMSRVMAFLARERAVCTASDACAKTPGLSQLHPMTAPPLLVASVGGVGWWDTPYRANVEAAASAAVAAGHDGCRIEPSQTAHVVAEGDGRHGPPSVGEVLAVCSTPGGERLWRVIAVAESDAVGAYTAGLVADSQTQDAEWFGGGATPGEGTEVGESLLTFVSGDPSAGLGASPPPVAEHGLSHDFAGVGSVALAELLQEAGDGMRLDVRLHSSWVGPGLLWLGIPSGLSAVSLDRSPTHAAVVSGAGLGPLGERGARGGEVPRFSPQELPRPPERPMSSAEVMMATLFGGVVCLGALRDAATLLLQVAQRYVRSRCEWFSSPSSASSWARLGRVRTSGGGQRRCRWFVCGSAGSGADQ